ncbi:NrsF family protein [Paracoccus sp. R86501]|uniref:NrsF family protein n=1 Tax=Paracoccus sp. R86501 TaxID=3101711 RepID=UPI00367251C2
MKTDDLVELIAMDGVTQGPAAPRVISAAAGLLALTGGIVIGVLGLRADLVAAMGDPVTALKWLIPLALMAAGAFAAVRLTHPERSTPVMVRNLIAVIAIGAVAWWLAQAMGLPDGQVVPRSLGNSAMVCLGSIAVISGPALVAVLYLLRAGASSAPMISGALAGLGVAGAATAIYALHCNEDAPLFFIMWYGLGIGLVTAAGAMAGRRLLRW